MKTFKFILTISVFSFLTAANTANAWTALGPDSKAELSAQSYPSGGIATGTAGYTFETWRDDSKPAGPGVWQYGYIRPFVEYKTSVVTNRLTAGIEYFPVAILGISAGGGIDGRNYKKFSDMDCESVMCDQSLAFQFVQARLIAGYGKFAAVLTGRYDMIRAESNKQAFYDEMSYLIGRPGDDQQRSMTALVLYRDNPNWSYGAIGMYQQFIFSQANSSSAYAVVNYTDGPWQATGGLGQFHSSHHGEKASAIVSIVYRGAKGFGLLD